MNTVVACLWAGHDLPQYSANRYNVEDVTNLWRCMRRHITDSELVVMADPTWIGKVRGAAPDETLRALPFEGHGIGGWSPIMEVFRGDLHSGKDTKDRVILCGLDTMFVGPADWLFEWTEAPVGLPCGPGRKGGVPCNAIVSFNAEGARILWDEYLKCREKKPFPHAMAGKPSEMQLMREVWKRKHWPLIEKDGDGRMLSYTWWRLEIDADNAKGCSVVYFHGGMKPRNLPDNHALRKNWA